MSKYNCKATFIVKMETTEPIEAASPFLLESKILEKIREGKNLETRNGNGLKISVVDIKQLNAKEIEA